MLLRALLLRLRFIPSSLNADWGKEVLLTNAGNKSCFVCQKRGSLTFLRTTTPTFEWCPNNEASRDVRFPLSECLDQACKEALNGTGTRPQLPFWTNLLPRGVWEARPQADSTRPAPALSLAIKPSSLGTWAPSGHLLPPAPCSPNWRLEARGTFNATTTHMVASRTKNLPLSHPTNPAPWGWGSLLCWEVTPSPWTPSPRAPEQPSGCTSMCPSSCLTPLWLPQIYTAFSWLFEPPSLHQWKGPVVPAGVHRSVHLQPRQHHRAAALSGADLPAAPDFNSALPIPSLAPTTQSCWEWALKAWLRILPYNSNLLSFCSPANWGTRNPTLLFPQKEQNEDSTQGGGSSPESIQGEASACEGGAGEKEQCPSRATTDRGRRVLGVDFGDGQLRSRGKALCQLALKFNLLF